MSEILLENAPQKARDLFNKGFAAFERGNLDYAIDVLTSCLQVSPQLLQARKLLRAAEMSLFKQKKGGAFAHVVSSIGGFPRYMKARALVNAGRKAEALAAAEALLRLDPLNRQFIAVFGAAALLADLPEAGVQTLEVARDHYKHDLGIRKQLGKLYQASGRTREARDIFEKLCEEYPNNPELIKALKDAMALDSMRKDGWEDAAEQGKGGYRKLIRDEEKAVRLEQESKAVKSSSDVEDLIRDNLAKIEAEPGNVNYYRALARLYAQKQRFDEAIATLNRAMELSQGDPEVEAALTRTRMQQFDYEIGQLRETGDQAAAEARELEKAQFVFDNTQERVQRYPNDLGLRFEWGVMLFENDYVTEAIQQFQLAQRAPQHRTRALYFLGLCFKSKRQYDLAMEQLERAAEGLVVMDDARKDILYEMGTVAEAMGDAGKALECFKQIYQADIGFRDVAQKIEQSYR